MDMGFQRVSEIELQLVDELQVTVDLAVDVIDQRGLTGGLGPKESGKGAGFGVIDWRICILMQQAD
jgi:hypothetical protein